MVSYEQKTHTEDFIHSLGHFYLALTPSSGSRKLSMLKDGNQTIADGSQAATLSIKL